MRDSFSSAQMRWAPLAGVRGFNGQLGGWVEWYGKGAREACILGVWESFDAYMVFMDQQHDRIFRDTQQAESYEKIDVAILEPVYQMPGAYKNIPQCLALAKAIRISDCHVRPRREGHFVDLQKKIWIPGMRQAPGMLAGSFAKSKSTNGDCRYFVITLWTSIEAHEQYVNFTLPSLQREANVAEDVEDITGRVVIVNTNWIVMPEWSV